MPRADATELAPKKSATKALPQFPHPGAGGLSAFRQPKQKACISLVKLPSGGPGLLNARPAAFAGRSNCFPHAPGYCRCLHERVSYPAHSRHDAPQTPSNSINLAGNYRENVEGKQCGPLHYCAVPWFRRVSSGGVGAWAKASVAIPPRGTSSIQPSPVGPDDQRGSSCSRT